MTIIQLPEGRSLADYNSIPQGTILQGNNSTLFAKQPKKGNWTPHLFDWQTLGLNADIVVRDATLEAFGIKSPVGNQLSIFKIRDTSGIELNNLDCFGSDFGGIFEAKNSSDLTLNNVNMYDINGNEYCNGFYFRNCQNILMDKRGKVSGSCPGNALQIAGCTNLKVNTYRFIASDSSLKSRSEAIYIWWDENTSKQSTDIVISNSFFENYDEAITIRLGTQAIIENCTFKNCKTAIGARDLHSGYSIIQRNNNFINCDKETDGF